MANKNTRPRCYYSWLPADEPNHIHDMHYFAVNKKAALAMHFARGGNNTQCMVWEQTAPIMLPVGSVIKGKKRMSVPLDFI